MFEKNYPLLAAWIDCEGRIELGPDHYGDSILRIINEGGLVYEDEASSTVDER